MIPFEQNSFWFGVVEDVNDPEARGRVKVRIVGIHSEDRTLVPTEALPWSEISLPANNPMLAGRGTSPNGLLPGSCVGGIFTDPEDMQQPLVMFAYGGQRTPGGDVNAGAFNALGTAIYGDDNNSGCITADNDPTTQSVNNSTVAGEPTNTTEPTDESQAKWMIFAKQELDKGIRQDRNPDRIYEYSKITGVNSRSDAWCSSFVCWCLTQAGFRSSRSGMARGNIGHGAYKTLNLEDFKSGKKIPPYGSIIVIPRGAPPSGHVCFSMGKGGNGRVLCLHGNWGWSKYHTGAVIVDNVKANDILWVGYPNGAASPDATSPVQRNYNKDCTDMGNNGATGVPINPSENEKALIKMMDKYNITHKDERRMIWAQCAAETGRFQHLRELKSSYASSTSNYPGVGLIQVTGKANWEAVAKKLNLSVSEFGSWATASAENAAECSLVWWTLNSTNGNGNVRRFAQAGKINEVSICVNAGAFGVKNGDSPVAKGVHGMEARIKFWQEIQSKDV